MHTLSPTRRAIAVVTGVVVLQALMLLAFAWPQANIGPRAVPIAVAGPDQAVGEVETALAAVPRADDDVAAFDVRTVADEAAARDAIEQRDVYGAVVLSGDGPQLLVASGAGPAVAQMLRSAAGELAADAPPAVEDVVPSDPDDPNGGGLAAAVLPLVLTSAAGGLLIVLAIRGSGARLMAVVGLAVVAGLTTAALLQYGLGILAGPYLALSGAVGLVVGAVAASVAGLGALLGRAGAALGILVMIFVGNPLAAATSASEMLPQPWGEIGQFLPPGAGISLVRSVAFFDGAGARMPLVVLTVWLLAGLALVFAGARRSPFADHGSVRAPHDETAVRA